MKLPERDRPDTRGIERLFAVVGLAFVGWWAASMGSSAVYQSQASQMLERYEAPRPASAAPAHGKHAGTALLRSEGLIGRISIPASRISAVIAEGADGRTLGHAVGHLPGSALPGDRGRIVLAGHRDTFFRGLGRLRPGDTIRLTTPDGRFDYTVETLQVMTPESVEYAMDERGTGLTLVTCYPFHFLGPAPMRFVVRAVEAAPAVAARRG